MSDQRIKARAALNLKYAGDGIAIGRVAGQTINSLGGNSSHATAHYDCGSTFESMFSWNYICHLPSLESPDIKRNGIRHLPKMQHNV
jgi:hypothetical protein